MMDLELNQWLIGISLALAVIGTIPYTIDTLKGKTKPNRISWFLWSVVPLIGFGASVDAGTETSTLVRLLITGLLPLFVFLATFMTPHGYWKLGKFDYLCGFFSIIALIIWLVAERPILAIFAAATADAFAFVPTIKKAWNHPKTETLSLYIISIISWGFLFFTIETWNIENTAFPLYLFFGSLLMVWIIVGRRKHTQSD